METVQNSTFGRHSSKSYHWSAYLESDVEYCTCTKKSPIYWNHKLSSHVIIYRVLMSVSHIPKSRRLSVATISCLVVRDFRYDIFFCFDVSITYFTFFWLPHHHLVSTRIHFWGWLVSMTFLFFPPPMWTGTTIIVASTSCLFRKITAESVPSPLVSSWTKESSLWRVQVNRIWLAWHGLPRYSPYIVVCIPYLNLAHYSFSSSSYAHRKVPLEMLSDCRVPINGKTQFSGSLLPLNLVREPWRVVSQSLFITDLWWPVACRWYCCVYREDKWTQNRFKMLQSKDDNLLAKLNSSENWFFYWRMREWSTEVKFDPHRDTPSHFVTYSHTLRCSLYRMNMFRDLTSYFSRILRHFEMALLGLTKYHLATVHPMFRSTHFDHHTHSIVRIWFKSREVLEISVQWRLKANNEKQPTNLHWNG